MAANMYFALPFVERFDYRKMIRRLGGDNALIFVRLSAEGLRMTASREEFTKHTMTV